MHNILRFIYKNFFKKIANLAGYDLIIKKIYKDDLGGYEEVTPPATYAPWSNDSNFNQTYEKVKNNTLVDKYRCYELWQLVEQVSTLNGALIEVGVWKGGSGSLIAYKAAFSGIKDKVYLCDTFSGVVKAGENDPSYKGGEHADTSTGEVEKLIKELNLTNTEILVGIFPEDTGKLIKDDLFRFCHIDVDVYQSAKDIVEWIWPKLTVGGIIIFDDYGFRGCAGVTKYVNEQRSKKDRIVIHNLNGHAVLIKIQN